MSNNELKNYYPVVLVGIDMTGIPLVEFLDLLNEYSTIFQHIYPNKTIEIDINDKIFNLYVVASTKEEQTEIFNYIEEYQKERHKYPRGKYVF